MADLPASVGPGIARRDSSGEVPAATEFDVRAEGLDRASRLAPTWAAFAPVGTLILALVVGDVVPLGRRILWGCIVSAAAAYLCLVSWRRLRLRSAGRPAGDGLAGLVGHALLGAAWGSVALIAFPGPEHTDVRAVVILFASITSVLATVASAAAGPSYFAAIQVPLVLPVAFVVGFTDDRLNRLLGIAIPFYFVILATVHRGLHQLATRELCLAHSNAALVDSLVAEQDRTADANRRLRDANSRLSVQAAHDGLTGLANRVAFLDALDRAVATSRRHRHGIAVLYFDLDHFKGVNDFLGHRAGDELLVAVAHRLRPLLRPEDLPARLGGDEFTVLLPRVEDSLEAIRVAERLRAAMAEPFSVAGRRVNISVSIGVATTLGVSGTAADLIAHSDAAQYLAKQAGRDRVEVFDTDLHRTLLNRLGEEKSLRGAIADGQIIPHFQPMIDLATGRIVGAEALARWKHPERGILDAGEFIGVAEECGLLEDLDTAVSTAAIRARAELHRLGADPSFRVWLNISPLHLQSHEMGRRFYELMAEEDASPAWFGIEITETAFLTDTKAAAIQLAAIRGLGMKVALDDFGTGHSSLTLLRELPLDEIKIDRSFVAEILESPTSGSIVAALVSLAGSLGLKIVAEGVESAEQARHLLALGAQTGQGWLWSRALPLDELVASDRMSSCGHRAIQTDERSAAQRLTTDRRPTDSADTVPAPRRGRQSWTSPTTARCTARRGRR